MYKNLSHNVTFLKVLTWLSSFPGKPGRKLHSPRHSSPLRSCQTPVWHHPSMLSPSAFVCLPPGATDRAFIAMRNKVIKIKPWWSLGDDLRTFLETNIDKTKCISKHERRRLPRELLPAVQALMRARLTRVAKTRPAKTIMAPRSTATKTAGKLMKISTGAKATGARNMPR